MQEPIINQAVFKYNGDTEAFEMFMKALISEYLGNNEPADIRIEILDKDEITIVLKTA
ncbi:MAG: hypothetical protein J6O40_07675 [Ruminococcus sp.]|nr:hypothetical protein [Ruminococcus sp.]